MARRSCVENPVGVHWLSLSQSGVLVDGIARRLRTSGEGVVYGAVEFFSFRSASVWRRDGGN